jgi:hypothetical protein
MNSGTEEKLVLTGSFFASRSRVFPPSPNSFTPSEAFHFLGACGATALSEPLRRRAVIVTFDLASNLEAVLKLMAKYADAAASLADAALVRMTEALDEPTVLTTDTDFHVYRRHGRQVIP